MIKVDLIFDVGKTNKKCFLFDEDLNEVYQEYRQIPELKDEDGFPCDDLHAITDWIFEKLNWVLESKKYSLATINFSTYGASLVHLDAKGGILTPLYNYLRPYPNSLLASYYQKFGDPSLIAKQTSSPQMGMLNSGLQLFWLKYTKPAVFDAIHRTLHLPQYFSFLLTGKAICEYTSIGCHTGLWDFQKQGYHNWVIKEKIQLKFPPLVTSSTTFNTTLKHKDIRIGAGIHDSSATLVPYRHLSDQPFILISTGTWSISMNPFNNEPLSAHELENDCLEFLQPEGNKVKVARLFLGREYKEQLEGLVSYFKVHEENYKQVRFNAETYAKLISVPKKYFKFKHLRSTENEPTITDLGSFMDFEEAYHQLMIELVNLQLESTRLVMGKAPPEKIFIDGGFALNDVFVQLLIKSFKDIHISIASKPLGSSLGALVVMNQNAAITGLLKEKYTMKRVQGVV